MQSSGFHLNYFIDQKEHIATKLKCSVEFLRQISKDEKILPPYYIVDIKIYL